MNHRKPWALTLYGLVASATAPAILSWRLGRGKEDPLRATERLGRPGVARRDGPLIWLHGASVGESLSLLPLVSQLRDLRPDIQILVTTGTLASAELLAARLPDGVVHQFAPIDSPGATRRFFSHWRPAIGVFVESELWPNLVNAARASSVRLALVSARLSEQSWRNWQRFPRAARAVISAFDLIYARDAQALTRIEDLGGHVDGLWDAKLGAPPLEADFAELTRLRGEAQGLTLILAASTHSGEEGPIACAFAEAAGNMANTRLIVVPRHVGRGAEVAQIMRTAGLTVGRRSEGASLTGAQVFVADAMGELGLWYRLSAIAIMGGSFVGDVGGHNPLEPARLACPFVSGPQVAHWPIYAAFAKAGATRILSGPGDLADLILQALNGSIALTDMADRAREFACERDAKNGALAPRLLELMAK